MTQSTLLDTLPLNAADAANANGDDSAVPDLSLNAFADSQPLATRFFTQALAPHHGSHLANSYLLVGQPTNEMGRFVMRLAQIINCQQRPSQALEACGQCPSCKWITKNTHPEVITLTNTSYLWEWDADRGDVTPKKSTVNQNITVGQLEAMQMAIASRSPNFVRVVLISGGRLHHHSDPSNDADLLTPPPDVAEKLKDNQAFELISLNRRIFNEATANKFLKTLEEPPGNVLFFLCCDDESKVMDTIRSRCQVIPFKTPPRHRRPEYPTELAPCLETMVLPDPHQLWLDHTALIRQHLDDYELDLEEGLELAMQWAWQAIQDHASDKPMVLQLSKRLATLQHVKAMLRQKVRPDACLDELILSA